MAGTRNATGFARNLLIALAIVLVGGVAGSFWMGIRAKDAVVTSTVSQVQTIADNSLTLVFKPADLSGPASDERAAALRDQVAASVLDTSPFTAVTLWSQDGHILFSSDVGRIGTSLPGMRDRIKSAIKGDAQTQDIDGSFSVMAPFQLPSGVGNPAAIELIRPELGPHPLGVLRTHRDRGGRGGVRPPLEPLELLPLPADVPPLHRVRLGLGVPPPDDRLDVVGHDRPAGVRQPRAEPVAQRLRVGRPLAVPQVDPPFGGEPGDRPGQRRAGVRGDRVRQRREEVAGEPGVERGPGLRRHRPLDDDGLDAELAERGVGRGGLVAVRVAVAQHGDAVSVGEPAEEVERADALAGGERERQLFVEHGDAERAHGVPPVGATILPARGGGGNRSLRPAASGGNPFDPARTAG